MMKRQLLAFSCLLMSLGAMADDVQTVTVDGATVSKTVKQITFDGDNVILHYSDNTTDTKDMSAEVSIAFDLASGIDKVEVNAPLSNKVYNLRGQLMGDSTQGLPAGIYIVNGKKVIVK